MNYIVVDPSLAHLQYSNVFFFFILLVLQCRAVTVVGLLDARLTYPK